MSRGRLLVGWGSSALLYISLTCLQQDSPNTFSWQRQRYKSKQTRFCKHFSNLCLCHICYIPCAKANHTPANPSLSKRALQSCMARGVIEWRIEAINKISLSHFLFTFFCSHISTVSGEEGRCAPKWTGSLSALSVYHVPLPKLFPGTRMTFSLPSSINILTTFQSPDQMLSLHRSLL